MADMERIELNHRLLDVFTFALLDPTCGDEAAQAAWVALPQHELVPEGFAKQSGKLPRLVELRSLNDNTRALLLDLVLHQPPMPGSALCVALLQTEADAKRMIMHCKRLLAPVFPGGRRGIFRYYDPVAFEHLNWLLDDRARAALFGPITAWALPLRDHWYAQAPPDCSATLRSLPLRLDEAAWQRVYRIGALYAVLENDVAWRNAPAEWGPRAEALLMRAEQHQLRDRDDAVAFATHGLRWHADFDRHPRVVAFLNDCAGHPARYCRLSGLWTDDDWKAIAADLNATKHHHISQGSMSHLPQGACR